MTTKKKTKEMQKTLATSAGSIWIVLARICSDRSICGSMAASASASASTLVFLLELVLVSAPCPNLSSCASLRFAAMSDSSKKSSEEKSTQRPSQSGQMSLGAKSASGRSARRRSIRSFECSISRGRTTRLYELTRVGVCASQPLADARK
eukprot:6206335-Pleurochrysis_carterae.AAC.1